MPAPRNSSAALPVHGTARTRADEERLRKDFNPRQPRDKDGKWVHIGSLSPGDMVDIGGGTTGAVTGEPRPAGLVQVRMNDITTADYKPGHKVQLISSRSRGGEHWPKDIPLGVNETLQRGYTTGDGTRVMPSEPPLAAGELVRDRGSGRAARVVSYDPASGRAVVRHSDGSTASRRDSILEAMGGEGHTNFDSMTDNELRESLFNTDERAKKDAIRAELRRRGVSINPGTMGGSDSFASGQPAASSPFVSSMGRRGGVAPKLASPADPRLDRNSGAADIGRPRRKLPKSTGNSRSNAGRKSSSGRKPKLPNSSGRRIT